MPLSSEIKKYFPSFLNYLNENKSKFEDILFDNFPYCIIKDFEINSRELRDIIRRTSYLDDNPHTKRQTKILDIFKNYTKSKVCQECLYNVFCPGNWKESNLDLYLPVRLSKKEKEDKLFYFKKVNKTYSIDELSKLAEPYKLNI